MEENKDSIEIIDFDDDKPQTQLQPAIDNNKNVILDNSVVNPQVFEGLSESNVDNGLEAFNQTENILNESIKNNFGTDDQIQEFNSVTTILEEDKKNLEQNALETAQWVKESMERNEAKTNFNASIDPTINNVSTSINFDKPVENLEMTNEQETDVVDNTSKNKKGIAFIVILFIILFAFVFALPYITK